MEQRCDTSAVAAMRISETLLPGIKGEGGGAGDEYASDNDRGSSITTPSTSHKTVKVERSLWILHSRGVLAVVP